MNPHFVLNILNAKYSYTIVNDAPQDIFKLIFQFADSLKYMVYGGTYKQVSLKREIEHIENFIRLLEFRPEDKIEVRFEKNLSNEEMQIPPLLLIHFVKNAFKYTDDLPCKRHPISIAVKGEGGVFEFNRINPRGASTDRKRRSEGIGIANTKRRLELLFQGNHHLSIEKTADQFEVQLNIELV